MAYSSEQIGQFLDHIGLPRDRLPPSPSFLHALHVHTIATQPYDNLSLHYNPAHAIILDPQHLFNKIVAQKRGRGGNCMENALLFNHVLRGLGFDAYTAGVRSRPRHNGAPQGDFSGWQVYNMLVVKFLSRSKKTGRHEEIGSEMGVDEEKQRELPEDKKKEDEDEELGLEIYGKRMLVDCIIKENLGGRTRVVRELKTEEERVQALEIDLGITLTDEEKAGIRGWVAELKTGTTQAT